MEPIEPLEEEVDRAADHRLARAYLCVVESEQPRMVLEEFLHLGLACTSEQIVESVGRCARIVEALRSAFAERLPRDKASRAVVCQGPKQLNSRVEFGLGSYQRGDGLAYSRVQFFKRPESRDRAVNVADLSAVLFRRHPDLA